MEKIYKLVISDVVIHINCCQCASNFFDASRVVGDRQLWVYWQTVGCQYRIVGSDYLIRWNAFNLIDDVRRQLRIVRIQAGHDVGLIGDVQRPVLVRDVADGRLIGCDDERTVDEHGVGEMLGNGNAQRVEVLDVTNARLHGNGHVAYLRVQSDVFDFADTPEQRLHLILGGLWCDVRHLYHLSGGCDGRIGAGRHRGTRGSFQTTGVCVCVRMWTIRRGYMFRVPTRAERDSTSVRLPAITADTQDRRGG